MTCSQETLMIFSWTAHRTRKNQIIQMSRQVVHNIPRSVRRSLTQHAHQMRHTLHQTTRSVQVAWQVLELYQEVL